MRLIKKLLPIYVSLLVLIIFSLTLAKTTVSLDNGELAATSYLLGIPHPTGYPLFTIIGFLFSHISIPIRVIQKLNFLSAIYVTISVYFTIITIKLLIDEFENKLIDEDNTRNLLSEEIKILVSIFGGLVFAFSKTLWFQATNYEVYSLNIALISLIIFITLKTYSIEARDTNRNFKKSWLIIFVIYGLILSHHLSSSFIILPILLLYFQNFRSYKFYNLLRYGLVSFLIMVAFYSFIPIRASMDSVVGFGKPETITQTFEHITAKVYRPFFLPSMNEFLLNIKFFFSSLIFHFQMNDFRNSEFSLSILFAILGMIYILLCFRKIFYFLFGLLILHILIPSLYAIQDIDAFFIPAYFIISIFISFGFYSIIKFMKSIYLQMVILLILMLIVMIQFYLNFSRVNQSENYLMEDYFTSIVKELEPNSVVLNSSSWLYSMSLYFQLVEKIKPNVVFVNYSFVKEKWYAEQMNNLFAKERLIQLRGYNLNLNFKNRNIYLTYEIFKKIETGELNFAGDYFLIPFGLTFKLVHNRDYMEQPFDLYNLRFNKINFSFNEELKIILMDMIIRRIYYELQFDKEEKARILINLFIKKFGVQNLPKDLLGY